MCLCLNGSNVISTALSKIIDGFFRVEDTSLLKVDLDYFSPVRTLDIFSGLIFALRVTHFPRHLTGIFQVEDI